MYSNKHLKEVVCTFRFVQGSIKWDSAFFGQFYDKIINEGFSERQEKKGIVFEVNANMNNGNLHAPTIQEAESQMIFRNKTKNYAITMGSQFVSFHSVSTYLDWDNFNENLVGPFIAKYIELGIYDQILSCQVVYLNQFNFDENESLSDYFTVVTSPFEKFGKEKSVQIAKSYQTDNNVMLNFRINPQPSVQGIKSLMLECGAVGTLVGGTSITNWKNMSQGVKAPIRDFFESIITDKLRRTL